MRASQKVCAFALRPDVAGPRLLALSFASDRALPRRFPGGTVADSESPLEGLRREVLEETGLEGLVVVRKLGVQRYYKPYLSRDVERHDYLLRAPESAPASFVHTVSGSGDDAGELFEYGWVGREELSTIADEFRRHVTSAYVPELFADARDGAVEPADEEAERVSIVEHDPAWSRRFDEQRTLLEELFGDACGVEHIGSTAVPGLGAKPIVDIMVGVSSLTDAEERVGMLAWLGYTYAPEAERDAPERRYFRQRVNGRRAVHLHCVVHDSEDWRRAIAFRDALRSDRATAERYEALKRSLAARCGTDRLGYAAAKGPFIRFVLSDRGFAKAPDLEA